MFIRPRVDLAVRLLLIRNPRLLRSMLEAVLQEPVEDFELLSSELLPDYVRDKTVVLDVRVRLADKRRVNVEIQTTAPFLLPSRVTFYLAKLYTDELRRGDGYDTLTPTITVLWLTTPLFPARGRFRSEFELRDAMDGFRFTDQLRLIVLEIPHIDAATDCPEELRAWARWLGAETELQLQQLAEENPTMAEAKAAHDKLTTDPELEAVLRERDRLIMVEEVFRATQLAEMRKLGLDEGKRLGLDEGKQLGLDEGKRLGLDEGKRLGLDEGKRLGLDEGKRLGETAGKRALALQMLAGGMRRQELATLLGLSAQQLDDLLR